MLLVFWFLSRIGWYGRGRSNVPWSRVSLGDREKAEITAPFYNFQRRSPNSCLGRGTSRARTRKVGPFSKSIERRVSLSTSSSGRSYLLRGDRRLQGHPGCRHTSHQRTLRGSQRRRGNR